MESTTRSFNEVTCFGEILWDVFPGSEKPGGAPMNVAYHLHRLGIKSNIVSRIGNDKRGRSLLDILEGWGLSTQYIQLDTEHDTSEVQAVMDDNEEVTYEIVYPVAWDFIEWKHELDTLVETTDALVYGSLASRNDTTYKTLISMLEKAKYKVFDVNLREPHYNETIIKFLLNQANLLKLNEAELGIISEWTRPGSRPGSENIRIIQNEYNIDGIIVTRGGKGASFFSGNNNYHSKVYKVKVADTVGSGDAFLAAFLSKSNQGIDIQQQLDYASALGAFVASKEGACPDYTKEELELFIRNYD